MTNRSGTTSRIILAGGLLLLAMNLFAAGSGPAIAVGEDTIRVSGVTRGATVVLIGVTHEPLVMMSKLRRHEDVLTDSDSDGELVFPIGRSVPPSSVWAVADLTNGHVAVAGGTSTAVRAIPVSKQSLARGKSGKVDEFVVGRSSLELLYVHAGRAWTWSATDGTASEGEAAADGVTTVSVAQARAVLPEMSKPADFAPGGTLIAIDPSRLQVSIVRVDASLLGGVR